MDSRAVRGSVAVTELRATVGMLRGAGGQAREGDAVVPRPAAGTTRC